MAHNSAFIHGKIEGFKFPPHKLVIIGHDTPHVRGGHELWRADCKDPPPSSLVDSIRKHRVLQPGKCRKIDEETAEVVMGRDRTKACRVLVDSGMDIYMPMIVYPKNTPIADIIGGANAENFARKTEKLTAQIEHLHMQLLAEGYEDGKEVDAVKAVAVSTGVSIQRIRIMMAFRGDAALVRAVDDDKLHGEAALAIATLPEGQRQEEIDLCIARPDLATIAQVRERISHKKHNAKDAATAGAVAADEAAVALASVANGPTGHLDGAATAALAAASPARTKTSATKAGTKAVPAKEDGYPGLSKPAMKRAVSDQMALAPDARDLSPEVLACLKAFSGLGPPGLVPGLKKVMKDMGF